MVVASGRLSAGLLGVGDLQVAVA